MFYYFGYGSNMSARALKAKGVTPLSAEPAILEGWRLTFNIPDFFLIEGGTGNIELAPGHVVHGVLYSCRSEHLEVLDELEAVGVSYRRVKTMVSSYSGRSVSAFVYIGIPERLKEGYQPSRRYLNILVQGAEQMNLDPHYVRHLKGLEVRPDPVFRPFHFPTRPSRIFAKEDLKSQAFHTALAGAVFDMSQARPEHAYIRDFFAGKDMTLFFLKRMDSSTGQESLEEIFRGKISDEQKRYLTNYLHEFEREYHFVGQMDYRLDLSRNSQKLRSSPKKPSQEVPTRAVLNQAERINKAVGHENLGFLSLSRGFMPLWDPKTHLPPAFAAWDQLVQRLPELYRSLELRKAIEDLPLLDASEEILADTYLLRAAAVLAMLAHAYCYVETSPPAGLPETLSKPWAEVRRRLGREQEVLSYIDLIVYNWRFLDPAAEDPFRVENMRLMIPTVSNQEEQHFYLTQTEILARCSPIIGAIVRSQEAVKLDDKLALQDELNTILRCLGRVVHESLPKINPNTASQSYVDPVVWAKTVAPFAVPMQGGLQGPSGTSSPIFNLLDTFFGRQKHGTFLGKEIKALRSTYPVFWQDFIEATAQISIPDYVRSKDDESLQGLFREAFEIYAGRNGFLGRHRMKVFGYLEIAFKVGRSVTIGGFAGLFKDRTWEQVDTELEYSRLERLEAFPSRCHYGSIKSVGQTHHSGPQNVKHVVIDVSGAGIRYTPGDRCGILPENSDELIDKTLEALESRGDDLILLTEEWVKAAHLRYGFEEATHLDLRTFLRFAKIRPVVPRLAEALHALTQNKTLAEAIKQQNTARWELWDLLLLLKREGFDPKKLWRSDYHSPAHIARVVPPEQFRMYSISSAMETQETASEIHLTVGRVRYQAEAGDGALTERLGTASNFLATTSGRKGPISFIIDHPPRFCLPADPRTPIIMIAGGTGFAPFRSFMAARMPNKVNGPSWIILGLPSRDYFYYQDDLVPGLAQGSLRLDVIFSQEDSRPVFQKSSANHGTFSYEPAPRSHIQDLLLQEETTKKLWTMLQKPEHGGQGAYLYICGRTRFAKAIVEALERGFSRFFSGSPAARLLAAHQSLCQTAAEGRFMQEVFTHARSWETERRQIDISTVVDHNNRLKGYWMVIDNVVYDLTDFIGMHPGGATVLINYCGLDATQGFMKVHQGHSEIEAIRDMYEIGVVRPLDFKGVSRSVVLKDQARSVVGLSALYRKWLNILFLVVEMENALTFDQSLQRSVTSENEQALERTPYKIQRCIETHRRFLQSYAQELGGRPFIDIWELTSHMQASSSSTLSSGDTSPPRETLWMRDVMAAIHEGEDARFPAAIAEAMEKRLTALRAGLSNEASALELACSKIEDLDRKLLTTIKRRLRSGIELFERFQDRTLDEGAEALVSELRQIPTAFETYYRQARHLFQEMAWENPPAVKTLLLGNWQSEETITLLSDEFWTFEEQTKERVVILRRTPTPVDSIEKLIASNESIIALMQLKHRQFGIIVDMRQAPQRNDADFENAMLKLRVAVATNFMRVAVLLESATGVLQVNRIGRNDGAETFATLNEFAALRFAKGAA